VLLQVQRLRIPYTNGSSPSTYDNSNSEDVDEALETTLDSTRSTPLPELSDLLVESNLSADTTQNEGSTISRRLSSGRRTTAGPATPAPP